MTQWTWLTRAVLLAGLLNLSACNCGDAGGPDSGGTDASIADAGTSDASIPDAGPDDGGSSDAGLVDAGATDAGCVPTGAEVCDGVDNDCNGLVDDVDVGHDGIYDCLKIAVLGEPGLLASADFAAWLTSNGTTVSRLQQATTEALTPTLLAGFNVVILDRLVRDYTPDEAIVLHDWLAAGGGLVVLSGYLGSASDWTRPNSLLTEEGLRLGTTLLNGPVTTFVPHPLTQGLTSVTFSGGYTVGVVGPDGGLETPDGGGPVVVATLPSGPVGVCADTGRGRVFVWGDEWIEFDSEWRTQPQIPLFWANILGWVTHSR